MELNETLMSNNCKHAESDGGGGGGGGMWSPYRGGMGGGGYL